ncbi:tandem large repeat [Vibrio lamellibrachiae]|uniref:tandem large repeat n=1 Tax=Vibrio lamellibrachiae TaxID=2910253 RepID=UPI003D10B957
MLSACGGDSSDENTSEPPSREVGSISGIVYDAPVSGANVYVWEYVDGQIGKLLGRTTTDAFGNYFMSLEASNRLLLVSAQGGGYVDPLTNETVSVSNGKVLRLDSVINYAEGDRHSLMITPLTNMVAGLARFKIENGVSDSYAVNQSLQAINGLYGFDVNTTRPIDITQGGQSSFATPGHKYGALLTAYSSLSYDLIEKYGNPNNVYTSMHLADIQYRDVSSNGLLDGQEVHPHTGMQTPITFGMQRVTSDLYTAGLAKHVLIVVNDPELNISGTQPSDYIEFSHQINALGTPGGGGSGVIPPRDGDDIDTDPPEVERTDDAVLAKIDKIDVKVSDNIGIDEINTYIQYRVGDNQWQSGFWELEIPCSYDLGAGDGLCALQLNDFQRGQRVADVNVEIDTLTLDALSISPDTGESAVSAARIVVYAEDALGNKHQVGDGVPLEFEWNNKVPVINVLSDSTIGNEGGDFRLFGTVNEQNSRISELQVAIDNFQPEIISCHPHSSESGICEFEDWFSTDGFKSETIFNLSATDTEGNVGTATHIVRRDAQAPNQGLEYPSKDMSFVIVERDDERRHIIQPYRDNTYTEGNIQNKNEYLKIEHSYASSGIKDLEGVDFEDFHVNFLDDNKIPYVRVTVFDPQSGGLIGSSADKLKLNVRYLESEFNDGNYSFVREITSNTHVDDQESNIPHRKLIFDGDDYVEQMEYYIPFTSDLLGLTFATKGENGAHKLIITTTDEAGNVSPPQEVYFRSTFDLPSFKVKTPFIGATAQLYGLHNNGDFVRVGSCDTSMEEEQSTGNDALDLASCEIITDVSSFDFLRIRLYNSVNTEYYEWQDDPDNDTEIENLGNSGIGTYFSLNGSQEFYLTELSAYHTGLFDSKWENQGAGQKTLANAESILADVESALALQNNSFFGFEPTVTRYATNEDLRNGAVPSPITSPYHHRFLVEAIAKLAEDNPLANTVDFASAFYEDLSSDGVANGKGRDGQKIYIGPGSSYPLTSSTYRRDLATAYYNNVTQKYGVELNMAQMFADLISTAYPKFNGQDIFEDGPGGSIDDLPPSVSLTVESGRSIELNRSIYIAGTVDAKLLLEDPSGIKEVSKKQVWFAYDDDEERLSDIDIDLIEESPSHVEYGFRLYSQDSSRFPNIAEWALKINATDNVDNSHGEDTPEFLNLFIDNEPPTSEYQPPLGLPDADTFLNANSFHELTFRVNDLVGDVLDKRSLLFVKGAEQYPVPPTLFDTNEDHEFTVILCVEGGCTTSEKTIYPGDGIWEVYVLAEDNLGNRVIRSPQTPSFTIRIDSQKPIVDGNAIEGRLGGNSEWRPVIEWGDLSPGKKVDIYLQNGQVGGYVKLEPCNTKLETCDTTHLTGQGPDVAVQLVASDFTDDIYTNSFRVKAFDSAFPENESDQTYINFLVDTTGPTISLGDPWVKDTRSGGSSVLGRSFSVYLDSVVDEAGVAKTSVYQRLDGEDDIELKSMTVNDPDNGFRIDLTQQDTSRINLDSGNDVYLYVKAVDNHDFEDTSNINSVTIDWDGPSLNLIDYDKDGYYLSAFDFQIRALDYEADGINISPDGVNADTLMYQFYTTEPNEDWVTASDRILSLNNTANGPINILLKAEDVRGNEAISDPFEINIHNSRPVITSHVLEYADGEEINDNKIIQNKDIRIRLNVQDNAGIDRINATYRYHTTDPEQGTDLSFQDSGNGEWVATIASANLPQDGEYAFNADVYNQAKYQDPDDRQSAQWSLNPRVERQGVQLAIESPSDFSNHIAGKTLKVDFKQHGEVFPRTIECWIRDEYYSDDVPQDNDGPSSSDRLSPGQPISCSLEAEGRSFHKPPVKLITRTVGTNGTSNVEIFTFRMMDSEAPTVDTGDTYNLHGNEVQGTGDDRMLSIELGFTDSLSGVDISNLEEYPKIVREQGSKEFSADSCRGSGAGTVYCKFTGNYLDMLDDNSAVHNFRVVGLKDNAGNEADPHNFELKKPTGKPTIEILSPDAGSIISGNLSVEMRIGLLDNTYLNEYTSSINGTFGPTTGCEDGQRSDMKYVCRVFRAELGDDDGHVSINFSVTDVFDNRGNSEQATYIIDRTPPSIDGSYSIAQSPDREGYLRFNFGISDPGSGIKQVTYYLPTGILDDGAIKITKIEDGSDNSLYFEAKQSNLAGEKDFIVTIEAWDNVDNHGTEEVEVNVSTPDLILEFTPSIHESSDGKRHIFDKSGNQNFSIRAEGDSVVKLENYTLELVSTGSGSTIKEEGSFGNSPNATGSFQLNASHEGQYTLKLTVVNEFEREITAFKLLDKDYDFRGADAVVDFGAPLIGAIVKKQIEVPIDDKYTVYLETYINEANLDEVLPTLRNPNQDPESPVSQSGPDEKNLYIAEYLVEASEYPYTFTLTANDLADNTTTTDTKSFTVEASSVPLLTAIDFEPSGPLGGGQESTVTLSFSEEVFNFDIGDILLSIENDNGSGATNPGSIRELVTGNNITWTATYTSPSEDADIVVGLEVKDGSFESENTIPGIGRKAEISVNAKLPTLTSVVFSPIHQVVGGTVDVTFEFNESVTGISAQLGSESVTGLKGSGTSWEGAFVVGNTSGDHHKLTVSDFEDNWGNIGLPDTSYRLPITPTVTVDHIETVNKDNVASVYISGSTERFSNGNSLTATFTSENGGGPVIKDRINVSNDTWNFNVNLKALNDGEISLVVEGQNAQAVSVEGKQTFTLEASEPSVTGVVLTPKFADDTEIVTIEASFNKPVTKPSGSTLGSNTINWSGTEDSLVWQGTVEVSAHIKDHRLPITIKGYQDSVGNIGDDYTDTSLPLTPHITIIPIEGDVNEEQAKSLLFEGASDRFLSTDKLTLDIEGKSFIEVDIDSSGAWNKVVDVSDLTSGSPISYYVSGTNEYGAVAEVASSEFMLDLTKPTVSSVSIAPEVADAYDEVQIRVEFDSRVTIPNRSNIGGIEIDWETKGSNTKTSWVGTIVVPDNIENEIKTLAVTIGGFNDSNGNTGNDHISAPLLLKPTISFNPIDDVSLEDASEMTISGVTTRFSEGQTFEILITDNSGGKLQKEATIGSGGSWNIVAKVDTLALGTISVTASGNNGYTNASTSTDFELVEDPVIVRKGNQIPSMGRLALYLAA